MSFIETAIKYAPAGDKPSYFSFIVYAIKGKYHSIVEDPNRHVMKIVANDKLSDYLQISKISTDWFSLFDGERFIKIQDNHILYYAFPLFENEYNRLQLNFMLTKQRYSRYDVEKFESKNFELTVTNIATSSDAKVEQVIIKANLPVFKLSTMVELNQLDRTLGNYSMFLFMNIKNRFYSFPYGNVMNDDRMCLGGNSRSYKLIGFNVDLKKLILLDIISSYFNYDVVHRAAPLTSRETTLDYNLIRNKVDQDDFSISFIDFLYYLAETADEEINEKLFTPVQNPFLISLQEYINRPRGSNG